MFPYYRMCSFTIECVLLPYLSLETPRDLGASDCLPAHLKMKLLYTGASEGAWPTVRGSQVSRSFRRPSNATRPTTGVDTAQVQPRNVKAKEKAMLRKALDEVRGVCRMDVLAIVPRERGLPEWWRQIDVLEPMRQLRRQVSSLCRRLRRYGACM